MTRSGFGAARRAVVCKLCTWVDSNTYKINEDVLPRSLQPLRQRMHVSKENDWRRAGVEASNALPDKFYTNGPNEILDTSHQRRKYVENV